jgi:hypothetical protein
VLLVDDLRQGLSVDLCIRIRRVSNSETEKDRGQNTIYLLFKDPHGYARLEFIRKLVDIVAYRMTTVSLLSNRRWKV